MKKFSIMEEASNRVHGGGNPFSNGHRSRKNRDGFLKSHFMIDLDEIIYDDSGQIIAIVEKKYKAESKKLGNILEQPTLQKEVLLKICDLIGCKLFVNITSLNKFYRIINLTEFKEYSSEKFEESRSKYKTYNSDDMIYIEYKKSYGSSNISISAVVKRLEDNINVDFLLKKLVDKLGCVLVKVDDKGDTIKFYKSDGPGGKFIGEVDSIINPTLISDNSYRKEIEDKWESIYRELGIW